MYGLLCVCWRAFTEKASDAGVQAAIAVVGMLLRCLALDNQHLNDFLARSNAGTS